MEGVFIVYYTHISKRDEGKKDLSQRHEEFWGLSLRVGCLSKFCSSISGDELLSDSFPYKKIKNGILWEF
jgi:hypothetical protein